MIRIFKCSFFCCGVLLCLSSTTISATLPDKDAAINSVVPHDWTGLYVGGNVGVVTHTMNVTDIQATSFNATIKEASNPQLTGGLQLGYRRQVAHTHLSGVYGLEFSTEFAQADFNQQYGSPYALYEITANNELKNTYLLQLLGGIAAQNTLFFFAAGLSWVNLAGGMIETSGAPYFTSFSANKTSLGTVLSGGIEYAWTKALSVRAKLDVITPNAYKVVDNLENTFQISNSVAQGVIGINYQFG